MAFRSRSPTSRIQALENRILQLDARVSEYRVTELDNSIVDLEFRNRDLSRQVDGLERMVQVLQAFSLLASRRLAELERATGLPTPPAGPPPATPAPALAHVRRVGTPRGSVGHAGPPPATPAPADAGPPPATPAPSIRDTPAGPPPATPSARTP